MKRAVLGIVLAGWLADLLAREDPDIEAGIVAYEAEDWDGALASYAKAEERLGGRAEIDLNRGLALLGKDDPEGAKPAFESASESRDANIRASAHYELGNIAFDAQDWEGAIQQYIDCLKARPDHGNAKWNLELAMQRKKEQEDKEKEEEKEQEQNEDEKQDDEKQDDEKKEDEKKEDEKKEDEKKEDEKKEDEKKEDEQKAQPAPIDRMDIERALEQLDQEDPFDLDRPKGGYIQPEKDW